MSKQYPGGLITKTPVTPSGSYETSTASGIWTLDQQAYWRKLNQWPTAGSVQPDAQFNYVTMLLHGDGTNGAQNNTFLDSSTNNFTITRNGNTTQGSFSPYGSNWSNYFNGDPTRLSLATATALGTGNVTIEFWFNTPDISATYYALYDGRTAANTNTGFGIFQYGQTIEIYGNGLKVSSAASAFTVNTWTHFAVVRTSGTCQIYINGVASGSSASYSDDLTSTTRTIARNATAGNIYTGYISNLREVTSALYSGTFTPSTTALTAVSGTTLLTCQSNRFIDNSTNAYAITITGTPSVQRFNPFGTATAYSTSVIGGSGYFDGSGDYLSTANSSAFAFGTGNFTVEFWYRGTSTGGGFGITTGGSSGYWQFNLFSSTLYWSNDVGVSNVLSVSATSILNGAWNHVAIVRNSTTLTLYFNGVSVASASDSSNYSGTGGDFRLGLDGNSAYIAGYIADYRIVKGTAVYTSAFTPPTAPLTAITNTSLMTNFTNGAIFDNAMMNDLETAGNAQISTSVVKYGTGSMLFDGTGDYLSILNTPVSTPSGTENWTIEGWVYRTTTSAFKAIYVNGYPIQIFLNTDNIEIYISSTNGFSYIVNGLTGPAASIALNTWTHFAVVRNGSIFTIYVNGVGGSTATSSTAIAFPSNANATIGDAPLFGAYGYTGYIDDFRITKGYARYTANFTPPTAAFSNIGPT
jgi:hypothetical protein